MVTTVNTLLVDGTFDDQVAELAEYIDNLRPNESPLSAEIAPMLEKGEKEDVMEKIVEASSVLSLAPEKGSFHPTLSDKSCVVFVVSRLSRNKKSLHISNYANQSLLTCRIHSCLQSPHSPYSILPTSASIHRYCDQQSPTTYQILTKQFEHPVSVHINNDFQYPSCRELPTL